METNIIRGNFAGSRSITGVVAVVVSLAALTILANPSAASVAGKVLVSPSGGDDTSAIQAAFDSCVSSGSECNVELGEGTFHTGLIIVHNFHGKFRGAGEGRTVVESLPNMPATDDDPIWLNPPNQENPWPDMFIFVDGAFSISDVAFRVPHVSPTDGWTHTGISIDALHAVILVIGEFAHVTVERVHIEGGPGTWDEGGASPFAFNVINGIFFEGLALPEGFSDPFADLLPISGTFRAMDNSFQTIDNPFAFAQLDDTRVVVRDNAFDLTFVPFAFLDVSDSVLEFADNEGRSVVFAGAAAFQGIFKSELEPSRVVVGGNDFGIDETGFGVFLLDVGAERTLHAIVADNEFILDRSQGGILSLFLMSTSITGNTIRGAGSLGIYLLDGPGVVKGNKVRGADIGILLESAGGVVVKDNRVTRSAIWGIALIAGSSGNLVMRNEVSRSGEFDLFWDETGSGNIWRHNDCKTSSPAGLCEDD